MSLKQQLQQLNNHLDKYRRKLLGAEQRGDQDVVAQFKGEINKTLKQISDLKVQQGKQQSAKGETIKALAFNRPLSKGEQADLGKLKKSVRGLVVVHPMTSLGREMGVKEVTGFAPEAF